MSAYPIQGNCLVLQRCPHCGIADPGLILRGEFNYSGRNFAGYCCTRCFGAVLAEFGPGGAIAVYPDQPTVAPELPERAKAYLQQAIDTLQSPSASILMSASAIDAMLRAKGFNDGSLFARIDKAVEQGLLTSEIALWAHEVRLVANSERHADDGEDLPGVEDSRRALQFAEAIGEILFVLPARRKREIPPDT